MAWVSAVALTCTLAHSQAPMRFAIKRYQVEGATLLQPSVIAAATLSHTGKQKDFDAVLRAIAALEKVYIDAGYGQVQVEIPTQINGSNVFTLRVVEPLKVNAPVESSPQPQAASLQPAEPVEETRVPVVIQPIDRSEATPYEPIQAPLRFPISRYQVDGNTLLQPGVISAATKPYTGEQQDFETIQRALEALEKAYLDAGYGSVRVEIPEQELEGGVITLRVIEGVLGNISVENNPFFDEANVLHSLPALQMSRTVNIQQLNRNLVLANEGGTKVTTVTFKRNVNNRDVDAIVKLVADDPQRWLATLDNTGSATTGRFRTGLVYQNNNLFNRDHSVSLQWIGSPDHLSDVRILGASYRVPLYARGDALEFNVSSSSVNSGHVAQAAGSPDLAISGSGTTVAGRYVHNLDASAESQSAVSIGLEQRAYGNNVAPISGGASLVPDFTTRPLILGFSNTLRTAVRDVAVQVSFIKNLAGAANGTTADFNLPGGRAGSSADFQALKISAQHTERFTSQWMLRTGFTAQYTDDLLISAEQFGVGGADSVRGLSEREVSGDTGIRAGMEIWAPPLNADPWRLIPIAFFDAARVWRNKPAIGEIAGQSVSSVGLGFRAAYGKHLNARFDYGYILNGVTGLSGPGAGDHKAHLSFMAIY